MFLIYAKFLICLRFNRFEKVMVDFKPHAPLPLLRFRFLREREKKGIVFNSQI